VGRQKAVASPLPFYLTSANDGTLRARFMSRVTIR
jgi:hypothetical protein